jgi:hypothetical protein
MIDLKVVNIITIGVVSLLALAAYKLAMKKMGK